MTSEQQLTALIGVIIATVIIIAIVKIAERQR